MASRFQRFLWTVAGAELDILENCRTDHKRFSAIGGTILMTAFIAFCAGTAAAWYFTQSGDESTGNIWVAMLFGVVWSLLIFSIDRSLVVTLKKDPTREKQKFWVPLLSRAALALVIAFMVSIPLELVIFQDFIAEQKFFFDESAANSLSESSHAHKEEIGLNDDINLSTGTMDRLDNLNNKLKGNVNAFNSQIQVERNKLNKPTTTAFTTAQTQYNNYNSQIAIAQKNLADANTSADSTRLESEINNLKGKRQSYWRTMESERKAWNNQINAKIKGLESERTQIEGQIEKNTADYEHEANRLARTRDMRDSLATERGKIVSDFKQTSNAGNHFIQNFRILEYAVWQKGHLTELLFLWLIRLLFFIIELLPTVVKIVTPVGSYDRMVYAEEKQMMEYLESKEYIDRIRNMHDVELKAKEEQLKLQHETELKLKGDILEKVKEAQLEVAEATVKKWKKSELAKVKPEGSAPERIPKVAPAPVSVPASETALAPETVATPKEVYEPETIATNVTAPVITPEAVPEVKVEPSTESEA
ncbi:MAG: DUF4407 domain-containing protein [Candidatus Cryptobacteroides sp.]